jgi:hypothetical protein
MPTAHEWRSNRSERQHMPERQRLNIKAANALRQWQKRRIANMLLGFNRFT